MLVCIQTQIVLRKYEDMSQEQTGDKTRIYNVTQEGKEKPIVQSGNHD